MQAILAVLGIMTLAVLANWLWGFLQSRREQTALATLEDMSALGEVVPDTLHPIIDPNRCMASGACVQACPEKRILGIVHGRALLINPLACVGHSACADACPVGAVRLVFGTATRGVELPRIDRNFQTARAGLYVIGELGGMGLIRNAVRQGKQAAAHVVSGPRRGKDDCLDAIVVGAGPAGISATLALLEGGLRVVLLEGDSFGGAIAHYPRAKVVMTGTLELALYGNVRRRKMSKEQLLGLWNDIKTKMNLPVVTGELVEEVTEVDDNSWQVRGPAGVRTAANVLLGLGRRGTPRKLEVPGEDLPKVHYRLLEPSEFRGKHVLVVGGGNSAVESALALADDGACASVHISYRRPTFARCRAENRRRIDEAIAAQRVIALMPSDVVEIGSHDITLKANGQSVTLANDAVIVQAGGTAPAELLAKFGIGLVTKYGQR
jgi:thioredoxin reductase/NAD-dependent dihydropyrimidine dehydrogenase PreA subunit